MISLSIHTDFHGRLFASADLKLSGYVTRTTLVVELLKKVQDQSI